MIQLQKSSAAIATLITFTLEGGGAFLLSQAYLIFVADAADFKSQVFSLYFLQSHVQIKIWQNCQIKALNIYLKWKGYNKIVVLIFLPPISFRNNFRIPKALGCQLYCR